jgi:hypothetical protein
MAANVNFKYLPVVRDLTVASPAEPVSGNACLIGASLTGLALNDMGEGGAEATKTVVDLGIWEATFPATAVTTAIAPGTELYLHSAGSPAAITINNTSTDGVFFGYATSALAVGTGTVRVLHSLGA